MNSKFENKQTIYNLLSQFLLNATNFILIMVFTRYLSTDNYGVAAIYQAYALLFSVIIGISTHGTIGTAFIRLNKEVRKNIYLSNIFLLSFLSFIVVFLFAYLFRNILSDFSKLPSFLIILIVISGYGTFCFNFLNFNYVYKREAQKSFILSLVLAVMMIFFSYLGIKNISSLSFPYLSRIIGLSTPYVICGVGVSFLLFSKLSKLDSIDNLKKDWLFCLPICVPLVFHNIAQIILGQTDKIMLQKMLEDYSIVGIYTFIVTFTHITNSIYIALNNTWIPIYYNSIKNNDVNTLKLRSKNYIYLFTSIICGFIMLSPEVIKLVAKKEYWDGIIIIPIATISVYMVFLYSFAINFELYNKKSKAIAIGTMLTALINVILNYFLIPIYGIYGAVIATFFSYFFLFVFHYISAKKITDSIFPFRILFFVPSFLIVLFFSIVFYVTIEYFFLRFIISLLFGAYIFFNFRKNKTLF